MDKNKIMADVYKDFFGENLYEQDKETTTSTEVEKLEEEEINIDGLFIDEDSKKLLNRIIEYMKLYSEKQETNYIPFNISIESDDPELINKIIEIIKHYSDKYNYCVNKNFGELSLFKIEDEDEITEIYSNGMVSITNLDALNMQDVNFKNNRL